MYKIFDFQGHIIDVSIQEIFVLTDAGLNYAEGEKITIGDPLSEGQRRTGRLLFFTITVYLYKSISKRTYRRMPSRDRVKLPLYIDGIYARIETNILKNSLDILVQLACLESGQKPDILVFSEKRRGEGYFQSAAQRDQR